MFFGGDWYGFDDALFAAARLLQYVAELGGPLSRLLADLPATVSTPEVRVDCADEHKFAIVERAAQHFAARYPVSTLDGVRITFPDGWGLVRASNTQPVLVLRFEAGSQSALAAYRAEVEDWLAAQGVRPGRGRARGGGWAAGPARRAAWWGGGAGGETDGGRDGEGGGVCWDWE